MKENLGYFVGENGAAWTIFNDNSSNYNTVEVLGEYDGKPGPYSPAKNSR
ncbi:hypothetical protein M6C35_002057 [Vibrio metschnikovii]|nr:hypothetical protein [Vibrio metschnikovii]